MGALPLASGVYWDVVWGRCYWLAVCAGLQCCVEAQDGGPTVAAWSVRGAVRT